MAATQTIYATKPKIAPAKTECTVNTKFTSNERTCFGCYSSWQWAWDVWIKYTKSLQNRKYRVDEEKKMEIDVEKTQNPEQQTQIFVCWWRCRASHYQIR